MYSRNPWHKIKVGFTLWTNFIDFNDRSDERWRCVLGLKYKPTFSFPNIKTFRNSGNVHASKVSCFYVIATTFYCEANCIVLLGCAVYISRTFFIKKSSKNKWPIKGVGRRSRTLSVLGR